MPKKKVTKKTSKTVTRKKMPPKKSTANGSKRATPKAKPAGKAKSAKAAPANNATPAPSMSTQARDPRLPEPGTVLQKLDRRGNVRCECTVEAEGVRYNDTLFRSLSAAAMAAAKDLGLGGKTQNGFTFWGLSKPPRRQADPLALLDRTWERYHGRVNSILSNSLNDENREQVCTAIEKHAKAIAELRDKIA